MRWKEEREQWPYHNEIFFYQILCHTVTLWLWWRSEHTYVPMTRYKFGHYRALTPIVWIWSLLWLNWKSPSLSEYVQSDRNRARVCVDDTTGWTVGASLTCPLWLCTYPCFKPVTHMHIVSHIIFASTWILLLAGKDYRALSHELLSYCLLASLD